MSDAVATDVTEALRALRDAVVRLDGKLETVRSEMHAEITRLDSKLDARFDRLDTKLEALSERLRTTEHEQAAVSAKLELLTDRVVSRLPSWWQIPAILGSVAGVLAVIYAAIQFLRLHGWWPA
jgi:hypothetical protein